MRAPPKIYAQMSKMWLADCLFKEQWCMKAMIDINEAEGANAVPSILSTCDRGYGRISMFGFFGKKWKMVLGAQQRFIAECNRMAINMRSLGYGCRLTGSLPPCRIPGNAFLLWHRVARLCSVRLCRRRSIRSEGLRRFLRDRRVAWCRELGQHCLLVPGPRPKPVGLASTLSVVTEFQGGERSPSCAQIFRLGSEDDFDASHWGPNRQSSNLAVRKPRPNGL